MTTTENEDIIEGTTKAEENETTEQVEGTSTESIEFGSTEKIAITSETPTTEVYTDSATGIYEFDCDVTGEKEGLEELTLECKIRNGEKVEEKRTVYIVIDN